MLQGTLNLLGATSTALRCRTDVDISVFVAGAGLEPTISAYETERITIFHIPLYLILMKDSNLRLPAQRDPTYHLSNEKTVTHFHRQITNAYQTLIVLEALAGTSLSYPGFVFGTGFEPVPLP